MLAGTQRALHGVWGTGAPFLTALRVEGSVLPMPPLRWFVVWGIVSACACAAFVLAGGSAGAAPAAAAQGKAITERPPTRDQLIAGLNPRVRTLVDGKLTSRLSGGNRAVLTLDPSLDDFVTKLLKRNEVPYAGVVAMVPSTGRLLAYVSHSSAEPNGSDRCLDASAPAASVFKVITATALLNEGVSPTRSTCYHGGSHALTMRELVDNPRLDRACASLTGALGFSINAVVGKLALKHLDPKKLERQANLYGFGENLPFDMVTEKSALEVPKDDLEFARTAAGFWHMHLSPLHGAAIAATIANKGRMMRPELVDQVLDANGSVISRSSPTLYRKVTEPHIAAQLGTMMTSTVKQGTSRRTFHDARGRALVPGIEIAGKTGTLSKEAPYRGYSWWVGFAPVEDPKIALAVLVVNSPNWRIKASQVAAETLRHYLVEMPKKAPVAKVARH
jgi:cell division protein FtsI/penicillin-binding protein 2